MITPFPGAAFGDAADGDGRFSGEERRALSDELRVSRRWAWARQVHGSVVAVAAITGDQGEADAVVTLSADLTAAVATADCVPVAIVGRGGAAAVHAGWRGAAAGIVPATVAMMRRLGAEPVRAAVGPSIGPCCYEVGPDVAARFPGHTAPTKTGATGVDLAGFVAGQLGELAVWRAHRCTQCGAGYHSHRRDGTKSRQIALAWLADG